MGVDPRVKQRTDALARAQEIRLAKAELKRTWQGRHQWDVLREIADMLDDPECGRLESFKLSELLLTVPGIGKTKANFIARSADWVELSHRVSRLTVRQRELLARVLRQRSDDAEVRSVHAA